MKWALPQASDLGARSDAIFYAWVELSDFVALAIVRS